uniref:Uncharacterized protein n=1 Tax=Anatid alphaherpesvirus 2 TaxID=3080522 RepID=A0AAU0K6K1_9ALPH
MEAFTSMLTKGRGLACCVNGEGDPERNALVSGAVLYPDQLRPHPDGPRYVIAIGSAPCERSTLDFSPHYDALCPYYCMSAPSCRTLTIHKSVGDAAPLASGADWFPTFRCCQRANRDEDRLVMHNSGYGQPWCLLGDRAPRAVILRCIRIELADAGVPGLLRFWRDGVPITVVPLPEAETSPDDAALLGSEYNTYFPFDTYNVILFESERTPFRSTDSRLVVSINSKLREDRQWCNMRSLIRNTSDDDFGNFGECVLNVYEVDPETDGLMRVGAAVVYRGVPSEDIDLAIVEMVTANYATSIGHPHRMSTMLSMGENGTVCEADEDDYDEWGEGVLPTTDDKYGWVAASYGPGRVAPDAKSYSVSVTPECKLRSGVDVNPSFRVTRETMRRMDAGLEADAVELVQRRARPRYAAFGCDCDEDDAFVLSASGLMREEFKWVEGVRHAPKRPRREDVLAGPDGEFVWSVSQAKRSRGMHPSAFRLGEACPNDGDLSWYVDPDGGWVSRFRRRNSAALGSGGCAVPRVGSTRAPPRIDLDLTTERTVARSAMDPIDVRRCGALANGRAFNILRHSRLSSNMGGAVLVIDAPVDRDTSQRIVRQTGEGDAPYDAPLEMCFLTFVGRAMCPTNRSFFSCDRVNVRLLQEEMAKAIQRICAPVSAASSGTAFAFALASVDCDRNTGARTCTEITYAVGGTAGCLESLFDATRRMMTLCTEVSVAGIYSLGTVESIPELSTIPYRFVLEMTDEITDCATPRVVRCRNFSVLPAHWEEARVRGSRYLNKVPSQAGFAAMLTRRRFEAPRGRWHLGLFFPMKGIRLLTTEIKRAIGEYCQRFREWFQWGRGSEHYCALRKLVPLCDCYMTDVAMTNNFFGYGLLFHLHCIPDPEREKVVVAVLSRAIRDAQKFAGSSTFVDLQEN